MGSTYYLFCLFNGLMEVYIICVFFSAFAAQKYFKGRGTVAFLLSVAFVASLCVQKNPLLNFLSLLGIIVLFSLLYETKWYNRLFLSATIVLIGSFAELIVAEMSAFLLKLDIATLKTGYYYIIGTVLSKLLTFVLVAVIKIGKHSLPMGRLKWLWAYTALLPISSTIIVFVMIDYINKVEKSPAMQAITVFSMALLIITNVLIFYVIDRLCTSFTTERDLIIANEMIESQKRQYRSLFEQQSEIKKLRHDLKNFTIGVLHDLENNEIENARRQIKNSYEILSENAEQFVCGNSIIDTLILVKGEQAKKAGVTLEFNTELRTDVTMDAVDLAVLLGNAVDNAIEATEKNQAVEKKIDINIIAKNSTLVIVVKNPVEERVDVEHPVTTKRDNKMHGYGILQMRRVAEKYSGEVMFECEENEFRVTILVSNKKV